MASREEGKGMATMSFKGMGATGFDGDGLSSTHAGNRARRRLHRAPCRSRALEQASLTGGPCRCPGYRTTGRGSSPLGQLVSLASSRSLCDGRRRGSSPPAHGIGREKVLVAKGCLGEWMGDGSSVWSSPTA